MIPSNRNIFIDAILDCSAAIEHFENSWQPSFRNPNFENEHGQAGQFNTRIREYPSVPVDILYSPLQFSDTFTQVFSI